MANYAYSIYADRTDIVYMNDYLADHQEFPEPEIPPETSQATLLRIPIF